MQVVIGETGQSFSLQCLQPVAGGFGNTNIALRIITECGAIGVVGSDLDFEYDTASDEIICSSTTYSRWNAILAARETMLFRIAELQLQHGVEKVKGALDIVRNHRTETINSALDAAFGMVEAGKKVLH
jgi:hypothetical protein